MKILKIMIIFLILIISAGAVCASENLPDDKMMNDSNEIIETTQDDDISGVGEASFTDFENEIKSSDNFFNVSRDYKFNNETDNVG